MKNLLKNYIELLTIDKIDTFAKKNNIYLDNYQLNYILNLIKNKYEDILINEDKYFDLLKDIIDKDNLKKIKDLFIYYKNRYKNYLF